MDVNKVQGLFNKMVELFDEIRKEVFFNPGVNITVKGPATVRVGNQEVRQTEPPQPTQDIRLAIDDPNWPEAVPSYVLCDVDSDDEKTGRAESILDETVEISLRDQRFLDYGCGEGHVAAVALNRGVSLSFGYDPFVTNFYKGVSSDRLKFTSDKSQLEPHGYDVILLYDVLDHSPGPVDTLYHVGSLLAPGGTVFVHCHPWTSRHGGHLYRHYNKAYAHLWLDDHELDQRGIAHETFQKLVRPIKNYRKWFNATGFTVKAEYVTQADDPIEPYFTENPEVWNYLTRHFDQERQFGTTDDQEIRKILETEFVKYTLKADSVF